MSKKYWIKVCDRLYQILIFALFVYIFISAFTMLQRAEAHYANFVGVVFLLSIISAIKKILMNDELKALSFWVKIGLVVILLLGALISCLYIRLEARRLSMIQPFLTDLDLWMGLIFTIIVLVTTSMLWGKIIAGLITACMLYGFYGYLIPGILAPPRYEPHYVMSLLGMSMTHGYFWFARLAADNIFLLVVCGGLLSAVGGFDLFTELGKWFARYTAGGAAMPSILSSAAVGSVMGQAVSNIALTGRLTIPMMKQRGFTPQFAGSVETVISTSGQLLPPILGLGGFMMAGFLQIPYIQIALFSLIPGLLYVAVTIVGVLMGASHYNIPNSVEPIIWKKLYYNLPIFLIPLCLIIYTLLKYYTPMFAGAIGIISLIITFGIISFIRRDMTGLKNIIKGLYDGTVLAVQLSVLLVAIGAFAQIILSTNLGSTVGFAFKAMGLLNSPLLLLLVVMIAMVVIGMGMPTPVAYTVGAITLAPALVMAGFDEIPAHFFVFYFAVFSTMTPPVAVGVLTAAKIAGCSFWSCAGETLKLTLVLFAIPFIFATNPELVNFPNVTFSVLYPCAMIIIAGVLWAGGIYGTFGVLRLSKIQQILMMASSVLSVIYLITREKDIWLFLSWTLIIAVLLLFFTRKKTNIQKTI